MADVISLNATSPTEDMRQRFEAWAKSAMTGPREATTLLARSRGGDYVLAATRAGWASWQAAIADLIDQYQTATGKSVNMRAPCSSYHSRMMGGACQNCGHSPADHK